MNKPSETHGRSQNSVNRIIDENGLYMYIHICDSVCMYLHTNDATDTIFE